MPNTYTFFLGIHIKQYFCPTLQMSSLKAESREGGCPMPMYASLCFWKKLYIAFYYAGHQIAHCLPRCASLCRCFLGRPPPEIPHFLSLPTTCCVLHALVHFLFWQHCDVPPCCAVCILQIITGSFTLWGSILFSNNIVPIWLLALYRQHCIFGFSVSKPFILPVAKH